MKKLLTLSLGLACLPLMGAPSFLYLEGKYYTLKEMEFWNNIAVTNKSIVVSSNYTYTTLKPYWVTETNWTGVTYNSGTNYLEIGVIKSNLVLDIYYKQSSNKVVLESIDIKEPLIRPKAQIYFLTNLIWDAKTNMIYRW